MENDPSAYYVHDELLAPLKAMYGSLMDTGDDSIANGRLLDVMRQVCLLSCTHTLPSPAFISDVNDMPCISPNCFTVQYSAVNPLVDQPRMLLAQSADDLDCQSVGAMFWVGHGEAGHQAGILSPQ